MKRFFLIAMASLVTFGAAAQDSPDGVKESIVNFLKVEGYLPSIDDDGDISFKSSGDVHYIRVYDKDEGGFRYVELWCGYTAENTTVDRVARAANGVNGNFQVVRCYYSAIEGEPGNFRALFETPCYITTADEFNARVKEFLECIDSGSDRFYQILAEEPNDGGSDR